MAPASKVLELLMEGLDAGRAAKGLQQPEGQICMVNNLGARGESIEKWIGVLIRCGRHLHGDNWNQARFWFNKSLTCLIVEAS